MLFRKILPLLSALVLSGSHLAAADDKIFPLKDVKRGMLGEWRTVIAGTKIESFKLRVLGVQNNFAGPRRPVIICEALDDQNKLSGPVAGMSGSPVYIKNKLLGAYAYGFMMSKQQAIIGVTPIEQMLEVVENYGPGNGIAKNARVPSKALAQTPVEEKPDEANGGATGNQLDFKTIQSLLKPAPTPLFVSGFSARTLKHFEDDLAGLGVEILQAPTAGPAEEGEVFDPPLVPGAPIAGVLMDGDFSMAGVGTITWRKDNRLLAFGHPFFQEGAVEIPMAGAEVLTVVRSVSRSFKLSKVGPVKGSIYQDRLTAIAGEIGRETPCTKVTINIHPENAEKRTLRSNLFCQRRMSPMLCAMALMESISSSMDTELDQSFEVDTTLILDGHKPLVYQDFGNGSSGIMRAAMGLRSAFGKIVDNPFETPMVKEITFNVKIHNEVNYSILKKIGLRSGKRPRGGEKVKLELELAHYQSELEALTIEVPIPEGFSGERLVVFVGDADDASKIDLPSTGDVTSLEDILTRLRLKRDNRHVHVKLLKRSYGLNLRGAILPELPPSVYQLYTSDTRGEIVRPIRQTTIWETTIPVKGDFRGNYSFPLDIR